MKHITTVSRTPMAAQSPLETKLDFMVSLIGQAGDFLGVAFELARTLLSALLHFPLGGTDDDAAE